MTPGQVICLVLLVYITSLHTPFNKFIILAFGQEQSMKLWIGLPTFIQILFLIVSVTHDLKGIKLNINKVSCVFILNFYHFYLPIEDFSYTMSLPLYFNKITTRLSRQADWHKLCACKAREQLVQSAASGWSPLRAFRDIGYKTPHQLIPLLQRGNRAGPSDSSEPF